jgi:hypothetical protein
MSYEPSHRKPPRQERWPNATPGEGWPAYEQGSGGPAWESAAAFAGSRNGHGAAGNGYGGAGSGNGTAGNGYGAAGSGYGGAGSGYGTAGNGYSAVGDGYGDTLGGRSAAGNGYNDTWGGRGTGGNGYGDPWGGGHGTTRYSDSGTGSWAAGNGFGGTTTAYPPVGDGYADGFDGAADGYAGGYASAAHGYGATEAYQETGNGYDGYDGWDGYTEPGHEFTGSAGYLPQKEYPALEPAGSSVLVAPDTMGEWWRQADRGHAHRGPVVGAMMGFLAAAVAIGVATFAAAFVRPQASPVSAVGVVFFDRLPATLRDHLMAHFGAHGQTVLLLGAVGLAAMVFGCAARRNVSLGVAGIAALGLLGAFVAITRPESRASDVVPWAVGGLAGILALLWLARASAPIPEIASLRPAYGGRRRAR